MKTTKNIARLAVTAGLTAALSFGGVMAPVTMAFAAGTPVATTSGNVTIKDDDYTGTTYKGIKIFSATVTQDQTSTDVWDSTGEKTLSDITWASGDVKTAVMGVFTDDDNKPTGDDAQAWAEFIKEQAGSDNVGEGAKVNADNKLNVIAAKLVSTEGLVWTDLANSETKNLDAGYWLFVTAGVSDTANTTTGNMDAYTSPIFAIVGGADVNVKPKKDVPTVTKAVMDDKDGKWVTDDSKDVFAAANKAADSASDQPVEYQLAGSVASNINTYAKYSYTFTDELPTTMEPVFDKNGKPAVVVKIDETVVKPDCYSVNYAPGTSKNVLTVSFGNLKEVKDENDNDITVNGESKVYVNYQAKLVASEITESILGVAQTNTVKLTYSNNPHIEGTGDTVVHLAYDYTYGIAVTKVGSDKDESGNPKTLEGVQFTLREKDSSVFIKADGTTTSNKNDAILTTNENGKISVVGLDEGTYVLTEIKPAPGYNNSASNGVTFTIARGDLKQDGTEVTPDANSAHVTAADGVVMANSATVSTGKLSFTIVDKKGSNLPLTGLNGVTFTWIAGGAVLCIGVAHLIRSRKRDEGSEE